MADITNCWIGTNRHVVGFAYGIWEVGEIGEKTTPT